MRGTVGAETTEVPSQRLLDTRKYERSPAEDGTEKHLKAAIATNIIKGPPNGRLFTDLAGIDGRRQTPQAMRNHLRQTGGAGCEKNPFGWAAIESAICHGLDRSSAHEMPTNAETATFRRIAIAHDRIDAGICDHRGKIFMRQVRRTKGELTHNPKIGRA